jgi:hypothetical protein
LLGFVYPIGDPTLADGILDRLVHNADRIEMTGALMRKNRPKANELVSLGRQSGARSINNSLLCGVAPLLWSTWQE